MITYNANNQYNDPLCRELLKVANQAEEEGEKYFSHMIQTVIGFHKLGKDRELLLYCQPVIRQVCGENDIDKEYVLNHLVKLCEDIGYGEHAKIARILAGIGMLISHSREDEVLAAINPLVDTSSERIRAEDDEATQESFDFSSVEEIDFPDREI